MHTRTILSVGTTTTSVAAAAVTLGPATIPAAAQAPPGGTVALIPASGRDVEVPSVVTSRPCPAAVTARGIPWAGAYTVTLRCIGRHGSNDASVLTRAGKLFVPGLVLSSAGIGRLLVAWRRRVD